MEIAAIENDRNLHPPIYKHNWTQIIYMITSTICFIIEVYRRISVDLFYASYTNDNIHVPALNRYPTEFTASYTSISCIWYLIFIWQAMWIVYSFIGLFRRTSSRFYFYEYPCAMNELAFFYTALVRLLYIPQLSAGADNTYYSLTSLFRYIFTLIIVTFILIIVNKAVHDNMRDYFRDKYFLDVWLARLLYQNGLALWVSILFYESCLSIIISLIYMNVASPPMASILGSCIFLIGIIVILIYEYSEWNNSFELILSHWFIFFWLIFDIRIISNNKLSADICSVILVPLIQYFIIFVIVYRLRILYIFYKQKCLPSFHSGRVYSLIVPPTTF